MLSPLRLLRARLIGGSAALAVFSLSVFGIMATEGQAAGEYQAPKVEDLSTLKDRALECEGAGYRNTKFVFDDKSRRIGEIRMCTKGNSDEAFADAQHLALELKRAHDAYRNGEPNSAPVGDRVETAASFEEIVKTLEARLSDRRD
jgi:hypothetical protein